MLSADQIAEIHAELFRSYKNPQGGSAYEEFKEEVRLAVERANEQRMRPKPDVKHGTENAYTNRGCRCDECKEASRVANARRREGRKGSDRTPHGTATGYTNWGCRCDLCKAAMREFQVEHRERKAKEFPW